MAQLTRKQFADRCNMPTNKLSVYISRKKVVVVDDLIDTLNETNRAFLEKNSSPEPAAAKAKPRKTAPADPEEDQEGEDAGDGIPSFFVSETRLKHFTAVKREKEIARLEIEIAKKKGEVVPSELIKPLFLQHNQSITTEFKNGGDELIRLMGKKKKMSPEEIADLKGSLVQIINTAIIKATTASVKAVEQIINEHKAARGVGEKA